MAYENIVLIGFMGSGKSTIAKAIRRQTGMIIIDTDIEIIKREGKKIPEIFAEHGEAYFRGLETALLIELQTQKNVIVSCGGGAVLRDENIQAMQKIGTVVLLSASPYTIYNRVKNGKNRPLLEGKMNVNAIREMMEARKPRYRKAAQITVWVDRKPLKAVGKEIINKVANRKANINKEANRKANINKEANRKENISKVVNVKENINKVVNVKE